MLIEISVAHHPVIKIAKKKLILKLVVSSTYIFPLRISNFLFKSKGQDKNYLWKNVLQCVIEFKSAAAEKEACQEKTNFVCVRAFELPP